MKQAPALNETPRANETIDRWVRFWNLITLGMLLITTAIALFNTPRSPVNVLLIGGFGLVYLLWYWYFIIRLACWGRESLGVAASFAVMMLALAAMTTVNGVYMIMLFSLYGILFSVLVSRLAIPLTVLLSILGAGVIITNNGLAFNESYGIIIGFTISTFFSMMVGRFIAAIIRQNFERQQIIDELTAARASLAIAEREAGILEERQRLAREIHDTLAQGFTSIVMHLEAADQALPGDPQLSPARQHLDRARATARDSLSEARRFVWALRAEPLEQETLVQAVRRVAQRWSEESGAAAQVAISGEERPLPSPFEVTLLRAAQEALANVRKHAGARQVNLTLTYMDDQVILDVQDDGQGFQPDQPRASQAGSGLGLLGMRERVEQLGGSLLVESAPGEGATLVIALPLAAQEAPLTPGP